MAEMTCRWNGLGKPRLLRSHEQDCQGVCEGCQPCTETHCGQCGKTHVGTLLTCPECVGTVRADLGSIGTLTPRLMGEAMYRGVNSEAANLAGPVADPEAWTWRKAAARKGAADHVSLTEDDDNSHPLWVLGTWEMLVREHLEQPTDALVTIAAAKDYLGLHLTALAQDGDFAFEELARELRRCVAHLEDVLAEGEREERGEKCYMCDRKHLVKDYGKTAEDRVRWRCPNTECGTWYSEDEYREKFETKFIKNAPELTLSHMARRLPLIPAGTMRRWASKSTRKVGSEWVEAPAQLRSCGKDSSQRKLYRVADVEALWAQGGRMTA